MRRNSSEFVTSFISEAGTFKSNKDYFAYVELDDMACFVVADGIDSDEEVNSAQIVADSIFSDFMEKPTINKKKLKKYMKNAHRRLEEESRNVRLKASLVLLVTDYTRIVWLVSGNARLYHFRKGRLLYRSSDQSMAQIMLDAGKITQDEANSHDEKNNLTNYAGTPKRFRPSLSKHQLLMEGDIILLCTSGCWESVDNVEMSEAVIDAQDSMELVDLIEEILLGKQKKVINNYSVAAVYANKVFKETPKETKKWVKLVSKILIPLVILAAGFTIYKVVDAKKAKDNIVRYEKEGDSSLKEGDFGLAAKTYAKAWDLRVKVNDKEIEERIGKKKKVAEYITTGDSQYKAEDFKNALDSYMKARSEADIDFKLFDIPTIEANINRTKYFINVLNLEKEGDEQAANQKYDEAIKKYEEALKLNNDKLYSDKLIKELTKKIQDTKKLKEEQTGAAKAAEEKAKADEEKAKNIEECTKRYDEFLKKADALFRAEDYKNAQVKYIDAKDALDKLEKIKNVEGDMDIFDKKKYVEGRIRECEDIIKLTVTPQPN